MRVWHKGIQAESSAQMGASAAEVWQELPLLNHCWLFGCLLSGIPAGGVEVPYSKELGHIQLLWNTQAVQTANSYLFSAPSEYCFEDFSKNTAFQDMQTSL